MVHLSPPNGRRRRGCTLLKIRKHNLRSFRSHLLNTRAAVSATTTPRHRRTLAAVGIGVVRGLWSIDNRTVNQHRAPRLTTTGTHSAGSSCTREAWMVFSVLSRWLAGSTIATPSSKSEPPNPLPPDRSIPDRRGLFNFTCRSTRAKRKLSKL